MKTQEIVARLQEIQDCVGGFSDSTIDSMIDDLIEDIKKTEK